LIFFFLFTLPFFNWSIFAGLSLLVKICFDQRKVQIFQVFYT
jgi:hypothetical protein